MNRKTDRLRTSPTKSKRVKSLQMTKQISDDLQKHHRRWSYIQERIQRNSGSVFVRSKEESFLFKTIVFITQGTQLRHDNSYHQALTPQYEKTVFKLRPQG